MSPARWVGREQSVGDINLTGQKHIGSFNFVIHFKKTEKTDDTRRWTRDDNNNKI